jgi:hypothetical protein
MNILYHFAKLYMLWFTNGSSSPFQHTQPINLTSAPLWEFLGGFYTVEMEVPALCTSAGPGVWIY